MYSRKRGFLPLRGNPNALAGFDRREKGDDLRKLMEELYGPTAVDEGPDEPEPDGGLYDGGEPESGPPESSDQPDGDASSDDGAEKDEGLGEPPDVEVI